MLGVYQQQAGSLPTARNVTLGIEPTAKQSTLNYLSYNPNLTPSFYLSLLSPVPAMPLDIDASSPNSHSSTGPEGASW